LDVASVEGERFTAEVVADVQAENVRGLVRRLSGELDRKHRLVNAQGIRRIGTGRRLSNYRFQHNLFQAYLYNNLDEVERAILHEDIGTALENLYGDLVEEITVDLARHFTEAGIPEQAAKYLRLAGEQAAAQYANDEAVSYLSRALEMVAESDLTERYDLLRTRERVYGMQGARTAQKQDLDTLAELSAVLDKTRPQATGSRQAEMALRQAVFAEVTGDYDSAIAEAERAIDLAEPAQDIATETAAYLCWGRAQWQQGDCDCARSPLERARTLAHGAGLRQEEAGSLHNLGIVFGLCGDLGEAQAHIEIALETYREIGDRQGEGLAVNTLGVIAAQQGDYTRAKERFEQALHVSRDIGDRRGEGAALGNVGQVCSDQGLYGEARRYLEGALVICREIEDREGEGAMLTNLGVIAGEMGDHIAAKDYFEQAVHILHETGNRRIEGFALGGLGLVLLRLGDYGPAGETLERGVNTLHDIDEPQGEGLVLAYRGLLYHRLGDDEAARKTSEEAARIAEAVGDRATQACALTHLGHALAALESPDGATDAYRQALEIRQELDQLNLAMEARAGLARVSLAQGDVVGAQAQVAEVSDYLETGTLDGAIEPFRVYLTCVQVLDAAQDPRAAEIKRRARQRLGEQAAGIRDRKLRESFLSSAYASAFRDL
jgi:tetratricopeptide (TPR) repeat protein